MKTNEFTTIEKLQEKAGYTGAVLQIGDNVLYTGRGFSGDFEAAVYEFIETPEETGLASIECRLALVAKAPSTFNQNGEAIKWCYENI